MSLRVQEQLQNGEIRMNAAAWPALAYPGDPPGIDFNIEDIQEGFLKGHILKRVRLYLFFFLLFRLMIYVMQVLRHIYTSPSSALIDDGELSVTRSGNAKLHGMYKVEAEHIAYALVQVRTFVSSVLMSHLSSRVALASRHAINGKRQMGTIATAMPTTAQSKQSGNRLTKRGRRNFWNGGTSQ